jgi:Uma2 family endonuclease
LASGDRLTRDEFERRYAAMPENTNAELIEGVVYMTSPVRMTSHAAPHSDIIGWLSVYRASTPGILLAVNCTLRLDLDNEPQPDALLMIDHRLGGQARIDEDDYVSGAPELLAEVAASSASYDLHDKLEAYRRNGIKEYVVWQVLEQGLDWFVLRAGEYEKLQPDASGLLRSGVFPGLWLDPAAMLDGEMATVLRRLQEGLGSPEHAEFVRRLQASDKP